MVVTIAIVIRGRRERSLQMDWHTVLLSAVTLLLTEYLGADVLDVIAGDLQSLSPYSMFCKLNNKDSTRNVRTRPCGLNHGFYYA